MRRTLDPYFTFSAAPISTKKQMFDDIWNILGIKGAFESSEVVKELRSHAVRTFNEVWKHWLECEANAEKASESAAAAKGMARLAKSVRASSSSSSSSSKKG